MSNVGITKEKMTEAGLRERRLNMIKEADNIGGYNFASINPAVQQSSCNEQSSVDISVEENIEEVEMMEQAGHDLMGALFDTGEGTNRAISNTDGSSKGSAAANLRFKMLKQKLFGPEIEKIQHSLDSKLKTASQKIKEDLEAQLRRTEYQFSEKLVIVDEYLERLDRVNTRHREFVTHLEKIH